MRTLLLDELDFISGGIFSWSDLGASMFADAVTGGMAGAMGGPGGFGLGIVSGALIGGAGYYSYTMFRNLF